MSGAPWKLAVDRAGQAAFAKPYNGTTKGLQVIPYTPPHPRGWILLIMPLKNGHEHLLQPWTTRKRFRLMQRKVEGHPQKLNDSKDFFCTNLQSPPTSIEMIEFKCFLPPSPPRSLPPLVPPTPAAPAALLNNLARTIP